MASHHKGLAPVSSPLKERNSWTLPNGGATGTPEQPTLEPLPQTEPGEQGEDKLVRRESSGA
jgi:hypothetical protein